MASNKETTLKMKNNAGNYIALYPVTTKSQVVAWNIGEIKGSYILTVKANAWVRNKQIIDLQGVSSNDILHCVQILEGNKDQMLNQKNAYNKLMHVGGIQSLNNQVMFVCDSIPGVDIKVQVWWTT